MVWHARIHLACLDVLVFHALVFQLLQTKWLSPVLSLCNTIHTRNAGGALRVGTGEDAHRSWDHSGATWGNQGSGLHPPAPRVIHFTWTGCPLVGSTCTTIYNPILKPKQLRPVVLQKWAKRVAARGAQPGTSDPGPLSPSLQLGTQS